MRRLRLIAQREFAAYASTLSFWLALVAGPLLMALAALVVAAAEQRPAPQPPARVIEVRAEDPALAAAARQALSEAAKAQGWRLIQPELRGAADSTLTIRAEGPQILVTPQGAALPPDALGRMSAALAQAGRGEALRAAGAPEAAVVAAQAVRVEIVRPPAPPQVPIDPTGPGRFALMMVLWMNLTGGLGMLLQAIVRERSNRALESLLAAARPHEIIFGKLIGVLAVSVVTVAAWGGAAAGLAALWGDAGQGVAGRMMGMALTMFRDPAALAEAAVVYLLTFVLYGSALLGLGAAAKDLPSAQNMMRPVFGLLLIVFFLGMARSGGVASFDALVWAPPITPFLLLTTPPDVLAPWNRSLALLVLASSAAVAAWAASQSLVPPGVGRGRTKLEAGQSLA
jgi:ABC-2 type transport system permease protein